MQSEDDIRALEKLITQLAGLHAEVSQLAKKSPNDGLNKFKLSLVNKVISDANEILTGEYRPFDDFTVFDSDDLPTNSDAAMVIAQYIDQSERYRSDNVVHADYSWWYRISGETSRFPAKPPTKVGGSAK